MTLFATISSELTGNSSDYCSNTQISPKLTLTITHAYLNATTQSRKVGRFKKKLIKVTCPRCCGLLKISKLRLIVIKHKLINLKKELKVFWIV